MNATCKSVCSIVLLGLVVGCGGESDTAAPPPADGGAKANYPPTGKAGATIKSPASSTAGSGSAPGAKPADTKKGDEAPAVEGPKADNKDSKLTAEELAAIKELPAADQAAAIAQAICPVSTHHLGSMDKPVKVTADGRTFYICCDSCEDKVKSDPKGVIAKLDKK
jgi:YHS domain-containing protein